MFDPLSRLLDALGRRPHEAAERRRSAVPRIELLENRWVPSTIAGVVYNDVNVVGAFQPGDPLYANNPISLLNSAGQTIASTVTDGNGHYAFTVDQTISTAPATQEQDLSFGPNSTDSPQSLQLKQFDPSLGTLTGIDIVQDATLSSHLQVDNLDPVASTVEGQIAGAVTLQGAGLQPLTTNVQADESATVPASDGTFGFTGASAYDFGSKDATGTTSVSLNASNANLSAFVGTGEATLTESGTADVCACGPGNLLSMVRSTVSGQVKVVYHYTPSNALKPGQYTVVQLQNPPGTTDGTNTSDGVPVPPGTPADHIPVTLPPGGNSLNNDFGQIVPAKVSGYVYLDNNHDGVFDAGDAPIGNAPVTITGAPAGGVGVISEQTMTGADGSYSFDVPPGGYTIVQPTLTSGLVRDATTPGSLGGTAPAAGVLTVNLAGGANGINYDFGYVVPPTLLPPPVLPPAVPPVAPAPPLLPPQAPPVAPTPPPAPAPSVVPTPPLTKFDFLASSAWDGDF